VVTATASVTPTIFVVGVTQIPIVDSVGTSDKSKHHPTVKPAIKPKSPAPQVHKAIAKKHK
jgi:hypothetical protein